MCTRGSVKIRLAQFASFDSDCSLICWLSLSKSPRRGKRALSQHHISQRRDVESNHAFITLKSSWRKRNTRATTASKVFSPACQFEIDNSTSCITFGQKIEKTTRFTRIFSYIPHFRNLPPRSLPYRPPGGGASSRLRASHMSENRRDVSIAP